MKKKDEINETIMYLSRLFDKHTNFVDVQANALVFTIQVKNFHNTDRVQKAIYEKIHRAIYERLSSPNDFTFSMFIAGDVEGSRSGYIPDHVLLDPMMPHYHGIILFSKQDWKVIRENISYWKSKIKSSISDIREIVDDEIDGDGCIIKESIWIDAFDKKKCNDAKHQSPIGDYVQYCMKSHLQAISRSIYTYQPKVFPFDAYANQKDIMSASHLFDVLYGLQRRFDQERNLMKQQIEIYRHQEITGRYTW